jgi:hypothetical protein
MTDHETFVAGFSELAEEIFVECYFFLGNKFRQFKDDFMRIFLHQKSFHIKFSPFFFREIENKIINFLQGNFFQPFNAVNAQENLCFIQLFFFTKRVKDLLLFLFRQGC